MAKKGQMIAGIDIGTTKICTVIGQVGDENVEVLGVGTTPSRGLRRGIVVNLSETISSVKASLEAAESQSKTVVESAYVSIGGVYIRGVNCAGSTEVRSRNNEITQEDIDRAVADAQQLELPEEYQVLHVLTQSFSVDAQHDVVDPTGMFGKSLGVRLHVVVNASAVVQNIVNAVNRSGVVVDGLVMQQLASAEAILTPDEKDLGTIVVDIGGGTTDLALFNQGTIWHSQVLPLGSSLITKDLAIGLRTPVEEAEALKINAGTVFPESVPPEELVELSEVGTGLSRTLARQDVCGIIRARSDEILEAVGKLIREIDIRKDLATGVVLTGGGCLLEGLGSRAEAMFEMPVRLGYPSNLVHPDSDASHPGCSTALGLLRYAQKIRTDPAAARKGFFAPRSGRREKMTNWLLEKIS